MTVETRYLHIKTRGNCDIIDITPSVSAEIQLSRIDCGTVNIFIAGSTAGLTTIEFEPGLISDLEQAWERLIPLNLTYEHDKRWGDGNGHAHVRASLLGASLVVPFNHKNMLLGTWQQIVLVDFDNRHRDRELILQIIGD
ncbi:MAG TPA: secondary thiamine-phosphate synthase enzyme YjbQ [Dehalococcoidia bacterium]|nr:secondary thiamine-phosphate synthase enzyme YjbQ [Dehalococcoidia bacterium]